MVADLVEFCAHVHTKTLVPDVLIIDDLDFYLNQLTVRLKHFSSFHPFIRISFKKWILNLC